MILEVEKLPSVSVGIPAHNEASNIGLLLRNLSELELGNGFSLNDIIVVASGCTDGTAKVVEKRRELDPRIRLIVERERRGKASAVNILLHECKSDILVMQAADTIPMDGCIRRLVSPFEDASVGATSSRPIPINPENSVMGWIPHMIWDLYHYISKARDDENKYFHISGESCAIRTGIVDTIPERTVNDDAYIGLQIRRAGYRVVYVPNANVAMKGPTTIADLIAQRRRVVYGHMQLEKDQGARIPSIKPIQVVRMLPKIVKLHPKKLFASVVGIGIEGLSHMLARKDIQKSEFHYKWRMVQSTKTLMAR
jgi:cellulose synthase/poly-beta-1,6-N-acetylglucosamine synthase-like glycosyltransferase